MNRDFFNFKMRMSSSDWEILSAVMSNQNRFYTNKAQRDWFFNQVNRFVREVAIPFIETHKDAMTHRVEKSILIEEMSPVDISNVSILCRFAVMVSDSDHQYYASNADWLFKQINNFCREVAVPFIESYENEDSSRVEKKVCIQEIPFEDSTNIGILRRFAALKQKTVSQVIQKYIVEPRIIKEESQSLVKKQSA
jgi:hypothetical protein